MGGGAFPSLRWGCFRGAVGRPAILSSGARLLPGVLSGREPAPEPARAVGEEPPEGAGGVSSAFRLWVYLIPHIWRKLATVDDSTRLERFYCPLDGAGMHKAILGQLDARPSSVAAQIPVDCRLPHVLEELTGWAFVIVVLVGQKPHLFFHIPH